MWESLISITVIAALAMMSPGPDFILVLKNAARLPRREALATTLGINLGVAVHMSYCVAGIAFIIATTPWLFSLLKYAGAGYLIWIGVQALLSRGGMVQVQENGQEFATIGVWRAFSQGLACNLLNPKATLFFFSVFTQLIDPASSLSQKALIGGIIFIQGVLYWPLVVLALQHPRVIRAIRRVQRSVDRLLGGLLLALGIKVALS